MWSALRGAGLGAALSSGRTLFASEPCSKRAIEQRSALRAACALAWPGRDRPRLLGLRLRHRRPLRRLLPLRAPLRRRGHRRVQGRAAGGRLRLRARDVLRHGPDAVHQRERRKRGPLGEGSSWEAQEVGSWKLWRPKIALGWTSICLRSATFGLPSTKSGLGCNLAPGRSNLASERHQNWPPIGHIRLGIDQFCQRIHRIPAPEWASRVRMLVLHLQRCCCLTLLALQPQRARTVLALQFCCTWVGPSIVPVKYQRSTRSVPVQHVYSTSSLPAQHLYSSRALPV